MKLSRRERGSGPRQYRRREEAAMKVEDVEQAGEWGWPETIQTGGGGGYKSRGSRAGRRAGWPETIQNGGGAVKVKEVEQAGEGDGPKQYRRADAEAAKQVELQTQGEARDNT